MTFISQAFPVLSCHYWDHDILTNTFRLYAVSVDHFLPFFVLSIDVSTQAASLSTSDVFSDSGSFLFSSGFSIFLQHFANFRHWMFPDTRIFMRFCHFCAFWLFFLTRFAVTRLACLFNATAPLMIMTFILSLSSKYRDHAACFTEWLSFLKRLCFFELWSVPL